MDVNASPGFGTPEDPNPPPPSPGSAKPNPWIMLVAILKTSEIILNAEFICDGLLSM